MFKKVYAYTFLAFLALFSFSCSKKKQAEAPPAKPLFVKFQAAKLEPISLEFGTAGELKANKEILVSAERQGKIKNIFVREGWWVEAGQTLLEVEGKDVDADMAKAQSDYDSYKKLFDEGAISKQELLQYETTLKRYQSQKDNLTITAVSSGLVGEIYVDPGDYLKLGDPIMDLVQLYPLRASYTIPEKLLAKVAIGQKVQLSSDSLPGKNFDAQVDFIAPRVNPNTRTVLVRARILNPDKSLKANQFVRVKQVVTNKEQALLIREEAVYLEQGQEYAYVAVEMDEETKEASKPQQPNKPAPTHLAQKKAIKTGLRKPGKVEILEGLEEGEDYIYAGLNNIYPGAKLVRVEDQ